MRVADRMRPKPQARPSATAIVIALYNAGKIPDDQLRKLDAPPRVRVGRPAYQAKRVRRL
jgi:hypothetical protein